MPTYTRRYGLEMPSYDDPVDVGVINRNTAAIDAELARNSDADATVTIVSNQQILSLFEGDDGDAQYL